MFEEEKSYLKAYIEQISESSRKGGKENIFAPLPQKVVKEEETELVLFIFTLKPNEVFLLR